MALNNPIKGSTARKFNAPHQMLNVSAQGTPDLTVHVREGAFWLEDTHLIEVYGGTVNLSSAVPSSTARWVAVVVDRNGQLSHVKGSVGSSPTQPTLQTDHMPLAHILLNAGVTAISEDMIEDTRPFFRSGSSNPDHADVKNRNHADAHDISSITNLQTELNDRVTQTAFNNGLDAKADVDGTPAEHFVLNSDHTGVPSADVDVTVERGSEANVDVRWNESTEQFEATDNGSDYFPIAGKVRTFNDLADINNTITMPVDGMMVFVRGQGNAVYDDFSSPSAWVLAADGVTTVT